MIVLESQRQPGQIKKLSFGYDADHGIWTFCADLDHGQGFALTFLDEERHCFEVRDPECLNGAACYALRCWGFPTDDIEGLESVATGKRITRTGWCRAHPETAERTLSNDTRAVDVILSPGERRYEIIRRDIIDLERRLEAQRRKLAEVFSNYIDWSVQ